MSSGVVAVSAAKPDRKVFRPVRSVNRIPDEILNDKELQMDSAALPSNYNFEIPKTVRIRNRFLTH